MKGNFKIFKEGTDVSHGQTLQHEEMLGVGGEGGDTFHVPCASAGTPSGPEAPGLAEEKPL